VVSGVQEIAGQLAGLLDHYALKLRGGPTDLDPRQAYDDLLKALTKLQSAMTEAGRESASRLSDVTAPDALPRTLWRIRNDAVMVGRALREPLPTAGLTLQAVAMVKACADFLRDTAASLDGGARPDRIAFAQPHQAFQTAVEALRDSGATKALAFDDAARVFGLVFAIENLVGNLGDLADRVEETVGLRT